ncbi:MAG: potassium-transporting ATPase subunit KdpA [FCB group bacterium]|jgi:K+-transporting ATPase ATPase A chain|nr:potassium-transporting ATPase subunit KdpA [FCB group bacterium]
MDIFGWIQLALYMLVLAALTKTLGLYLMRVLDGDGRHFLARVFGPLEGVLYRMLRVDPNAEQSWRGYAVSMLMFSVVSCVFTYIILRTQQWLPLNPQNLGPLSQHLAFNTAVSFTTNTNWQSYGGESTLSYFAQMVGLTLHNFVSAAVGIAIAAALVRGIARHSAATIGNFWTDLVRINLYVLLPICFGYALFLVSQGMIQNFQPYLQAGDAQTIAQGPMASQVAIKMLGTNGGGFVNANASHPYENPTPLSNFLQMLSIFAIPSALTYYLGRMVKSQAHGWAVWGAMATLFLLGVFVAWNAEAAGNPRMHAMGVEATGNMEGKEVRFGVFNSALFATITTAASCGAVNSMHDSFTPIGGLVPMLNMQLGEVVFGGVGAGLYGMLLFVVLTVFMAGLMVGRTPEYLGKKIEGFDVKVCVLALVVLIFPLLGFTAWAAVSEWGTSSLNNAGPHGLSEMLYAFSSGVGNNGSAFAGLNANTPMWNTALGLAMLAGRFLMILPLLALAGNLAKKKVVPASGGTFPVTGATFAGLLVSVVLIVGALTYLPALSLGPILEHFLMTHSSVAF